MTGKDDAMLADSPVVAYAVKQTNGKLEQVGDVYDAAPYGIVVAKGQGDYAQGRPGRRAEADRQTARTRRS